MFDPHSDEESQDELQEEQPLAYEISNANDSPKEPAESNAGRSINPTSKPKKRMIKDSAESVREPGKSLFPFSKVQKIIKADEEIPIVAKEATFLISLATEEFIKRLCEASHQVAQKEKRTTVQNKDIATVVRKHEEFLFLDEVMAWSTRPKSKSKATSGQQTSKSTTLDHFVVDNTADNGKGDEDDIVMNEDGTMYAAGNAEDDL